MGLSDPCWVKTLFKNVSNTNSISDWSRIVPWYFYLFSLLSRISDWHNLVLWVCFWECRMKGQRVCDLYWSCVSLHVLLSSCSCRMLTVHHISHLDAFLGRLKVVSLGSGIGSWSVFANWQAKTDKYLKTAWLINTLYLINFFALARKANMVEFQKVILSTFIVLLLEDLLSVMLTSKCLWELQGEICNFPQALVLRDIIWLRFCYCVPLDNCGYFPLKVPLFTPFNFTT